MKKALILTSVASMVEQFNMKNIELLQELGCQVDVITNFEYGSTFPQEKARLLKENLKKNGVNTTHADIPRKIFDIKGIVSSYINIKKLINTGHYNIIHCHSPIGGVLTRLAGRASRKNNYTKMIYTAHGFHFFKGASLVNWMVYFPVEWICSFFTDVLITINKEDYNFAKKYMHAKKVCYVPGVGVDIEKYNSFSDARLAKRAELNIPSDAIMIFSTGELNKNKNHKVVLEALSQIKHQKIHYFVAGRGREKQNLLALAESYGISDYFHLLGYRSDIRQLLACADIFCLPSLREGLSVALMEAMAAGLPCIVSDIRGNRDLIKESRNGILVHPHDAKGFAKSIEHLVEDDISRAEMHDNNIKDIRKYSSDKVIDIMKSIYNMG